MTDFEKINQLLEEVKNCPDTDIHLYWSPMIELFIPLSIPLRDECASGFDRWAKKTLGEHSLKSYYAEFLMGANYILAEDFERAIPLLSKCRKSFEEYNDKDGIEMSSMLLGLAYRTTGNMDLALKTLLPAFTHFKESRSYPIFFQAGCNSLAVVHLELHNYEEAFSIFSTGYNAGSKKGDVFFPIHALYGMGKAKMLQGESAAALEYFNRALQLAEEAKSLLNIGDALSELAGFYFRTGNFEKAEQLNRRSLAIHEQENLTGAAITCCINLGEIYIAQCKWNEALEILNKGLALAEQIKVKPKIYQAHFLLSKVYTGKGDIEKSYDHYQIFHELREKVLEGDYARKLTDAKLVFEAEQTMKENIIIKKQKQEIENKNRQLQDTIDELTITKISRKARGLTLIVGIALILAEEPILHYVHTYIGEENLLLNITAKVVVILSLKPIDKTIEGYLIRRFILKRKRHALEKSANTLENSQTSIDGGLVS